MPVYNTSLAQPVAITGVGVVSPFALNGPETFERSIIDMKSGIGPYSVEGLDIHAAGQVSGMDSTWLVERTGIQHKRLKQVDRSSSMVLAAGAEAMSMAGIRRAEDLQLDSWVDRERTGISIGTGAGGFQNFVEIAKKRDAGSNIKPSDVLSVLGERVATVFSMETGATGSVLAMLGACAAGNVAITQAVKEIRSGEADIMLAGGCEAQINEIAIAMFDALGALDHEPDYTRASRPFDESRGGFVMSEGAAVFVLESLAHALKRGAEIHGVISGVGVSGDGDLRSNTLMNPNGPARAMRKALAQTAQWDRLYIKAHATATQEGDGKELEAIGMVFDPENIVGVSSLKGHFGHTIGASGPIETAVALHCLNNGILPNTLKLTNPLKSDEDWPHIIGEPRSMDYDTALCSSFGFGGENATVILQRYNPSVHA